MKLRMPYQKDGIDAVFSAFDAGVRSVLVLWPTGGGKTILFSHVAQHFGAKGRCIIIAHRDELIRQAASKLKRITGTQAEIEKADEWASDGSTLGWTSPYVVASVQSLASGGGRRRMHRFDPNDFSLLVFDEAHHCRADTYVECFKHFTKNPDLKVLGVTATGDRGDGLGLGSIFDQVVHRYEMPDAMRDGWLVPVRQRSVVIEGLDFSKIRTTAGDLNAADLETEMLFEKPLHGVAHAGIEAACGLEQGFLQTIRDNDDRHDRLRAAMGGRAPRKTLVFACGVNHAERLAEIINRWLPDSAAFVCGATPDDRRAQILKDFGAGRISFLVNVGIATEGFDEPGIELIVQGRKTKSRALAVQMIGRGTRPLDAIAGTLGELPDAAARCGAIASSAKPYAEVLDFVGNAGRHKLVSAVDILAGEDADEEVVARATELTTEQPMDATEALAQAEMEVEEDREVRRMVAEAEAARLHEEDERRLLAATARRAAIVGTADYSLHDVDSYDRYGSAPDRQTTMKSGGATDKQVGFLVKLGVRRETAMTYTRRQASAVIEDLKSKRCTANQSNMLRRNGYTDAEIADMNFDDASRAIDEAMGAKGAA